jgi:hypothetical protein
MYLALVVPWRCKVYDLNINDVVQDLDVDDQCIAISALWTLATPVPWDATCEGRATCATPCDGVERFNQVRC